MTSMTHPTPTRAASFMADMFEGSGQLSRNAIAMLICFAVCLALPLLDVRTFNGINVWHKPAKFFFSSVVLLATVAWALSLVSVTLRQSRTVRWSVPALLAATWAELAYITFRAARAEGSHYNIDMPLEAALYSLMGLGALTMTGATAVIGFMVWRNRHGDVWREAAGLGLMLGALLGTVTASVLAAGASHWIGGDQTDATGLPVFFWSTTGGDLRIAHFVGLHVMQVVPFAALSGRRALVYLTSIAMVIATAAVFVQAVMGIPLFKV